MAHFMLVLNLKMRALAAKSRV